MTKPNPLNDLPGDAVCACGHRYNKHYNGRGDCAERCGCIRFTLPEPDPSRR